LTPFYDEDGMTVSGLIHALSLLPYTLSRQDSFVFCNGEIVTGVSELGLHGQKMGEYQLYLLTDNQERTSSDIHIFPAEGPAPAPPAYLDQHARAEAAEARVKVLEKRLAWIEREAKTELDLPQERKGNPYAVLRRIKLRAALAAAEEMI
jgi:hypothetical protein